MSSFLKPCPIKYCNYNLLTDYGPGYLRHHCYQGHYAIYQKDEVTLSEVFVRDGFKIHNVNIPFANYPRGAIIEYRIQLGPKIFYQPCVTLKEPLPNPLTIDLSHLIIFS